ncbi:MAG TPA: heavy metal-associated domain-containing protein [Bacilli bacterium]|nr:heavy metal-associated domain-containing protein [Bacilli bacterium]
MSLAHINIRKAAPVEVRKVKNALLALNGVNDATVDLMLSEIRVEFADELVNLNQLRKTVNAAGIDVLSDWKEY